MPYYAAPGIAGKKERISIRAERRWGDERPGAGPALRTGLDQGGKGLNTSLQNWWYRGGIFHRFYGASLGLWFKAKWVGIRNAVKVVAF